MKFEKLASQLSIQATSEMIVKKDYNTKNYVMY